MSILEYNNDYSNFSDIESKDDILQNLDENNPFSKRISDDTKFHKEYNPLSLYNDDFFNISVANNKINNSEYINDPTSDLLASTRAEQLDETNQPFIHNNMVPFYGSNVKQNMSGTGVKSGNYTDGLDVNSGFNNATPYYTKLGAFTGTDDTYRHKKEVEQQFTPEEQQTDWVNGSPLFRPDDDRFKQSLVYKNDLAPCAQEKVGPGINLDPSVAAAGGFQQFTRIVPNNIFDYKLNSLEGRVIEQKFQLGGQEPTSSFAEGVPKNRPESFWEQKRLPTMTTKAASNINAFDPRPDYLASQRPGNATRNQINFGFGNVVQKKDYVPEKPSSTTFKSVNLLTGEVIDTLFGF